MTITDRTGEDDATFAAMLARVEAVDEAPESVRQLLAAEFGRHGACMGARDEDDPAQWTHWCNCGWEGGKVGKNGVAWDAARTAWRLHVADAALGVLRGEGRQA